MTGEVRKLARPVGMVKRRVGAENIEVQGNATKGEELEIVEVVRYKVVFSSRPEPVGGE